MSWLLEQQRAFGDALVSGVTPRLAKFFADDVGKLERRFDAYRRNYWANHRNPLSATYQVVEMLMGPAAFRELANAYIETHPSGNADLNHYGAGFADFIAARPIAVPLPYLPGMARVEWALLAAYGAADSPPFDFAALAAVPAERQEYLRLVLAPGATLIDSSYPLEAIWRAHQVEDEADRDAALMDIDLTPSPSWTLVVRDRADVVAPHALTPGEAAFCSACRDGASLNTSLAAAVSAEPGMDIGRLLPDWVGQGWIAEFRDDRNPT